MDKKLGRYVILHELLHFHIPNHGKLWKSLMKAYLGDYEKLERRLKQLKERYITSESENPMISKQ